MTVWYRKQSVMAINIASPPRTKCEAHKTNTALVDILGL